MMFSDININNEIPNVPTSSIAIGEEFINELKKYNENSKLNKEDYRNRIIKLYDDIGNIKPIDNEINDVIYFDNYEEIGLVLNKKDISLKQIWTEYRLIYNEKKKDDDKFMENKNSFVLNNFDELFDRISKKVDGLDKYIYDLNSLKKEVDADTVKLENTKESLEIERINFENYRRGELARLEKMKKDLNDKMDKINRLLVTLEDKMKEFIDNN